MPTAQDHVSWTQAGADAAAQATYNSIKVALEDLPKISQVEIFLQGSYANTTNIRADSDVDVVVMTTQVFGSARDRLSPAGQARLDSRPNLPSASADFRAEIHAALTSYYGASRVHGKNKCIRVDKSDGYVDADVVPCLQYRRFHPNADDIEKAFVEGIAITPVIGERIVNFPKEHIKNGRVKNFNSGKNFKKTVRQLKHLRNQAVRYRHLPEGIAPGYLLECMAFNVPSERFLKSNDTERLKAVLLWLKFAGVDEMKRFQSCDGVHRLFGDDPGGFDVAIGRQIAEGLWAAH